MVSNKEWYDINLKQQESQDVANIEQPWVEIPTRRSKKYPQVFFPKPEIRPIKKVPSKRHSRLGIVKSKQVKKIVRQYKRPIQSLNTTVSHSSSSINTADNQNVSLSNISSATSSTNGGTIIVSNNSKQSSTQ